MKVSNQESKRAMYKAGRRWATKKGNKQLTSILFTKERRMEGSENKKSSK